MPSDLLGDCRRVPVGLARSGAVHEPRGFASSSEKRTRRKAQEACSASQDWREKQAETSQPGRAERHGWGHLMHGGVMLCVIDSIIRGWGMPSRRREPSPTDPVGVSSFPCLLRQPTPLHKVVCGLLCSCRLLAELLGGLAYLRCDEAESWCVLVGLAGLLSWRFCMHGAYLQPLFCHTPQLVRGVHEGQIYLKEE